MIWNVGSLCGPQRGRKHKALTPRRRQRSKSLVTATAVTVVTLPVLLIYNVVAAPPAEIAMIEEIRVELPVSPSAIALGSSVGSGAIDLLAAFEAFEHRAADAGVNSVATEAAPALSTTTTAAVPATTVAPVTTTTTTTAAPTTTTAAPTTTAAAPTTTAAPTTAAPTTTTVVSNSPIAPYPFKDTWPEIAMWDQLAFCESTNNWSINTGNGFFGGIQFTQDSWEWVGGTGRADQATREEQIYRGALLWEIQTWRAWPGCMNKYDWTRNQTRL